MRAQQTTFLESKIRDFGGSYCTTETQDRGGDHDDHWTADEVNNCTHERRHEELRNEYHAAHLQIATQSDISSCAHSIIPQISNQGRRISEIICVSSA